MCLAVQIIGISIEQLLSICTWMGRRGHRVGLCKVIYNGIYIPTRVCMAYNHVHVHS